MGSQAPLRLPVIDFSNVKLNPGTQEWDLVKTQVRQALEEYGCFEALFDKIPLELRKPIFSAVEELFDLPLETKLQNAARPPLLHGYISNSPTVPLYESMGIHDGNMPEITKSFIDAFWPEGNPSLCKTMISFSEIVSELHQMVRRMVLESLGVEKYYDEHKDSMYFHLRVSKYGGSMTTETKVALKSHIDKNMVTILYQNEVDGFEVQTKDGEWINLKLSPNSFAVMVGESFYAWTNGRLHPPYHRVMTTGNEARYTIGLFSVTKPGYMVKTPEELVDDEHPLLFKPFDQAEYIKFRPTGVTVGDSALKAYCGV